MSNDWLDEVLEQFDTGDYTYLEAKQAILNQIDKAIPSCDSSCEHRDIHHGHGTVWWSGYNQAISELRQQLGIKAGDNE